ncbi:phosphoenolpyruvate carboxykinase (ATP) [Paenibacillus alginolyticus]|uniref:Phosphoenolpyruvate carboxykinase (ATP) n=1 Tax=Paenibacillus alginolyticus TaxID=59839 RepID=A0ABT4GKV4_9BACL|nr:phosphoenolpyruvate carboxykinase (ATP) [Paenibacillus alginolyticus]MCY9696837.1 phosphoenolpyruvate carboxykinase (ATP) [Paenibacillus alginolyticus]MEC0147649.1 phosphoenolpyruvate carboxykinase (ATP) [Paenibacillus alginolyticus]
MSIELKVEQLRAGATHYNLSVSELMRMSIERKEGSFASSGALQVNTGKYTGRSPKDKYIVNEASVTDHIDWGAVNQPMSEQQFERLYQKAQDYMATKELFIFDGFAGADTAYRLPIRVVNEYAWHNLFARQLFIRPSQMELLAHKPEFTVIALPGLKADPLIDGTRSETFICLSFEKKVVLIGGTEYAGEMKKSIFSVLNYILPGQEVLPMHCSANVSEEGNVALFFGLSGTGKTTLSADPNRRLIGDDEHGWSETGVFNFEGGCYAKCAGLTEQKEPQIWQAIRFGTVLENVVIDPTSGIADYGNTQITENTRAAYPLEYIPGVKIPGVAGHPDVIMFLTADASGVLPPISKLTKEQAMYHFLSGYTSKLAGTERGVTEPEATFSTCFGSPFLPLRPNVYAQMLGRKIEEHKANVYLINTGWVSGSYGEGERMNLGYTRAMVTAALNGSLEKTTFTEVPFFGLLCPDAVPGVPSELLLPRNTWQDQSRYDVKAKELAQRFINNFQKFAGVDERIIAAGPKI